MRLAVSSTAFRGMSLEEMTQLCLEHDLLVEFSSGLPYRADSEAFFLHASCKRLIHNYFPAPEVPFVLNLASLDGQTVRRSIEHARRCLELAVRAGAPFYSLHAGFCLDPAPETLGKPFSFQAVHPREKHWDRFLESVHQLIPIAERLGVQLLIENNVLAPFNYRTPDSNPTLCADPRETALLFETIDSPALGLLLDTGHWKVSARTLGFDPDAGLMQVEPYIQAIHHSDNDGNEDTNHPIGVDYWFLKHMSRFSHAMHVLEVHDQSPTEVKGQFSLLKGTANAALH